MRTRRRQGRHQRRHQANDITCAPDGPAATAHGHAATPARRSLAPAFLARLRPGSPRCDGKESVPRGRGSDPPIRPSRSMRMPMRRRLPVDGRLGRWRFRRRRRRVRARELAAGVDASRARTAASPTSARSISSPPTVGPAPAPAQPDQRAAAVAARSCRSPAPSSNRSTTTATCAPTLEELAAIQRSRARRRGVGDADRAQAACSRSTRAASARAASRNACCCSSAASTTRRSASWRAASSASTSTGWPSTTSTRLANVARQHAGGDRGGLRAHPPPRPAAGLALRLVATCTS